MYKEYIMGNVIVIASGPKQQVAVHLVRFEKVDKEPLFIAPWGITNEELNERIRAAGHRWPIHEQNVDCATRGHEHDEITGNCVYCGAYRF